MASINPFLPIQEGTGTPSPENERPIRPAVSIAGGKNLLKIDSDLFLAGSNSYINNLAYGDGAITWTGNFNGGFIVKCKPNTPYTYRLNYPNPGTGFYMRTWEWSERPSSLGSDHLVVNISYANNRGVPVTFTTNENTNWLIVGFYIYGVTATNGGTADSIQLEEGSTATSYEPYQSLDVYGGYLDIANSRIVEEWTMCDFSDVSSWIATSTTSVFRGNLNNHKLTPANQINAISDSYKSTDRAGKAIADMADKAIKTHDINKIYIYCKDTNYTTVSDFITAVTGKKIVYELETPVTHYLSPTQLAQAMEQLGIKLSSTLINVRRKILLNSPHLETVSGSVATFNTDMKVNLKECKLHFLPIQEGSGDPSSTNIRAISGWTGVTINKTGKNLWTFDNLDEIRQGIHFQQSGSVFHISGTNTNGSIEPSNYSIYYRTLKPGTYTFSINFNNLYTKGVYFAAMLDSPFNPYGEVLNFGSNKYYNVTKTITEERKIYISAGVYGTSSQWFKENIDCEILIQIENGSEPTAYEPYQGNQIPISFSENGTVYGGYADLINGELVMDYVLYTFTGNENFSQNGYWVSTYLPHIAATPYKGICSHYLYAPYKNGKIGVMYNERTCTFDGGIYNADEWKQFCQDQYNNSTPIQIAYKIKTPIKYQFTPQQIKTLIGRNNIWTDAGDVEIKYWKH